MSIAGAVASVASRAAQGGGGGQKYAMDPNKERIAQMMARRRTLNPNARTAAPGGGASPPIAAPKPAWQQLREQGIAGQGSAAANKAALAGGGMTQKGVVPPGGPPSGPIMAPSDPMRGGGMAPRPMTPEMVAQAQGQPGGMGERSGAKSWQGALPPGGAPPQIGGPVDAQPPGGPMEATGAGGDWKSMINDQGGLPPNIGGMGVGGMQLPPELMQRLQAMRMPQQSGAPGAGPMPPGGAGGFAAPQGSMPRPYGLQSFYGA